MLIRSRYGHASYLIIEELAAGLELLQFRIREQPNNKNNPTITDEKRPDALNE
jgi:hypothetical protein